MKLAARNFVPVLALFAAWISPTLGAESPQTTFEQKPSTAGPARFTFAADVGRITVRHEHASFNCCLRFSANVDLQGEALRLTEQDGDPPCDCTDIPWDVAVTLEGLAPGDYGVFLHAKGGEILATALLDVPETETAVFVRGRINDDDVVDISDAVGLLGHLYLGEAPPPCLDAADVNDDGAVDISDPVYLLGFLFLGGPAPPEPFAVPGEDPTLDSTRCGLAQTVIAVDFRRDGDFNGDRVRDLTDGVALLNFIMLGGTPPQCADAVDVNDDGVVDLLDLCGVYPLVCPVPLGEPLVPVEVCEPDLTPDRLGCERMACE